MNKYITQTIRAGFVLGVTLFASANVALASAFFIPAGATDITGTSATINAQVMNSNSNSYVWFEWSDNRSFTSSSIVGKQAFWGGSSFEAYLEGLNPGTTYYYRAIVVARPISGSAEAPVYSPIVSFRTVSDNGAGLASSQIYKTTQNDSTNNTTTNRNTTTNTNNTSNTTTNTNNTTNSSRNTASSNRNNSTNNTSAATTKDGFTNTSPNRDGFNNDNGSAASAIGAGDSMLPTTLVGWVAIIIALLVVLLIVRLIYEQSEKRKKARLAKKAAEAQAPAQKELAVA